MAEEISRMKKKSVDPALCGCGCGAETNLLRGKRNRFLNGHQNYKTGPRYIVEERGFLTPCHIWQLAIGTTGYGAVEVRGTGKMKKAHTVAWELVNGPVPKGLELDHLCRVRACVNAEHLEAVPCEINVQRGDNAKLTARDVRAIRNSPEVTLREWASRLGVTQSNIGYVRRGITWKNIEGKK